MRYLEKKATSPVANRPFDEFEKGAMVEIRDASSQSGGVVSIRLQQSYFWKKYDLIVWLGEVVGYELVSEPNDQWRPAKIGTLVVLTKSANGGINELMPQVWDGRFVLQAGYNRIAWNPSKTGYSVDSGDYSDRVVPPRLGDDAPWSGQGFWKD